MPSNLEFNPQQREYYRHEINASIVAFMESDPKPPLTVLVELFGVTQFLRINKSGAQEVDVRGMVDYLVEKAEATGKLPVLPRFVKEVLVPPGEGEINRGSGEGMEEKRVHPRVSALCELLSEMGIKYDAPLVGQNDPNMLRAEHSYYMFYLPDNKQMVLVNNQEGNATFIFYEVESTDEAESLAKMTKSDFELQDKPFKKQVWTGDVDSWKLAMQECLINPPIDKAKETTNQTTTTPTTQGEIKIGSNEKQEKDLQYRVQEFERAFQAWLAPTTEPRGPFNVSWLCKNGYNGLYEWIKNSESKEHNWEDVVNHTSSELRSHFVVPDSRIERTIESAARELEEVYRAWLLPTTEKRGKFNPSLLQKKHSGLYDWVNKNSSWEQILAVSSYDVRKSFNVKIEHDLTSSARKLEEAYDLWLSMSHESADKFNPAWLMKNGFNGLYQWIIAKSSWDEVLCKVSDDVKRNFNKRETNTELEYRITQFKKAYDKWTSLPEESRGKFNPTFLVNNGYGGLRTWIKKNNSWNKILDSLPINIQDAFEYEVRGTDMLYRAKELEKAHDMWSRLPTDKRGRFNANWLNKNGFVGLSLWINRHSSWDKILSISNEDIRSVFQRQEKTKKQ